MITIVTLMNWLDLPTDIHNLIFALLDPGTCNICRFVCRRWRFKLPLTSFLCSDDYVESLSVFKWVLAKGCYFDDDETSHAAAERGKIDILQHIVDMGTPLSTLVYDFAVEGGQLETLKWLRTIDTWWDCDVSKTAVEKGYFEIFQWLVNEGCPWTPLNCMAKAAKRGSIEMMEYIYKQVPHKYWVKAKRSGEYAAAKGHLNVLIWLKEHKMPVTSVTIAYASKNNHHHIVAWAREQNII
jgi:F-box domain